MADSVGALPPGPPTAYSPTPAPGTDIASVLATVLQDGVYRLVVRDGKIVAVSEGGLNSEFMTMAQIAEEFSVSYFWVSRNWRTTLRLNAYRMGKAKLFKRNEVYTAIERTRVAPGRVGRPKKVIGVIA